MKPSKQAVKKSRANGHAKQAAKAPYINRLQDQNAALRAYVVAHTGLDNLVDFYITHKVKADPKPGD
jgi:hypothetical protein